MTAAATTAITTTKLNRSQAKALVVQINNNLESARSLLLELYDGRGWEALGYETWRACVVAEFGQHQATLYRQLAAAEQERDLAEAGFSQSAKIPDSHLRAMQDLSPQQQIECHELVLMQADADNRAPTAEDYEEVAHGFDRLEEMPAQEQTARAGASRQKRDRRRAEEKRAEAVRWLAGKIERLLGKATERGCTPEDLADGESWLESLQAQIGDSS